MKRLAISLTVLATLGVFTIGDATVGERRNPELINQFGEVIIKAKSHSVAF